jgi:hypothetical protein
MAKERKKRIDPAMDPALAEAIASASMPNDDDDYVRGSAKDEVKATGSLGMHLWLYSPARVLLLSEPTRSLAEVAQLRGLPDRKIKSVEAILQRSTRTIIIFPADEEVVDDGYKVTYKNEGTTAEINLRTLLQPKGLEVTRGWREKYAVKVDKETKFGPALVFTLTLNPPRERVGDSKKAQPAVDEPTPKAKPKRTAKTKAPKTDQPAGSTTPETQTTTPDPKASTETPKTGAPKQVDGGPPPSVAE